jgi:uncharacterized protein YbjT (DUF2867 family)
MTSEATPSRLTVAVTGPTGDIGRSLLRALERSREVGRVAAMARRPFDPAAEGLRKVEYRWPTSSPAPTWSSTWRS